jgi:alpha-L-rhamnosidase
MKTKFIILLITTFLLNNVHSQFSNCKKDEKYGLSHTFEVNGLHIPYLSFSWKINSSQNKEQSAYQIILYTKDFNDNNSDIIIWDSGKTKNPEQFYIPYSGPSLNGGISYFSKVKVWDSDDLPSEWSKPKKLIAPLNYPRDWKGKWVTYDYSPTAPLPLFRKEFKIKSDREIDFARFYIASPGFYEAYINGVKIGKSVLDPAQTNYDDYMFYSTYDVPLEQLNPSNVLGVMLGNGWYNQNVVWNESMIYGQPIFMAQLELYYKNGSRETIKSDTSWKWKEGPITSTNIYAGEYYDARKEIDEWINHSLDADKWNHAILTKNHPPQVVQQFAEPIKVMDSIVPKDILPTENGNFIFDFGQNFTGWVRLQIKGCRGQEITIRFAEELDLDGQMDFRSTGVRATKVVQTEKYTFKSDGLEIWEPRFTYHGFRYAEVSGLLHPPTKDLLTGMVVYSAMNEVGSFKTSEPNINKLHELTVWTLKSNLQGIPTDCPHREKCGWTGDAHAIGKTLIYNYGAHKFLTKYLYDMRSSGREEKKELHFGRNFHDRSIITKPKGITTMIAPGKRTSGIASPDWGTAVVQLPWYLYLYYGDKRILEEFYGDMKTWVAYVHAKKENGIIPHGLGDWCPPGGNKNIDCPVPISSTAFHILDVSLLAQTARVLGFKAEERKYSEMKEALIDAFNQSFLDKEKITYGSQTANSLALEIGIVPKKFRKNVAKAIVTDSQEKFNGFLNTGIFGLARIFQALSENGFEQEAYQLLSKKGNNSFEAMWKHYGATTLWEVLPTNTDPKNYDMLMEISHSHPMQGGFDAWFYSGIAGINPSPVEPGFKKIIFKPYLTKQLKYVDASYESRFGIIKSKWKNKEGKLIWEIQIPNNTTGEVYLPNYKEEVSVKVNGKNIDSKDYSSDFTFIDSFGEGNYIIEMTIR